MRFARDKRGYEYVYLVHDSARGGRPSRPVVLYWYRTPPGVKVGRPPFDEEVRQRLEAQNPEIRFDWRAITSAQPPPPDAEHWRERRRAEKAAKQARIKEERDDAVPEDGEVVSEVTAADGADEDTAAEDIAETDELLGQEGIIVSALQPGRIEESAPVPAAERIVDRVPTPERGAQEARSHRRRRRRKHRPTGPNGAPASSPAVPGGAPAASVADQADPGDPAESRSQEPEDS